MQNLKRYIWCMVLLLTAEVFGQDRGNVRWWDPAAAGFPVVEGQAWPWGVGALYDRLPAGAEKDVRPVVWKKSHETAGLLIRFKTDAAAIQVRYGVGQGLAFEHMPATGVSGVDLYIRRSNGRWEWPGLDYVHGDTMRYYFNSLRPDASAEYYLYLPLYNSVQYLQIGVPEGRSFTALPVRNAKPIVVYGTSIAQGGCASRPGLAWPAVLGRLLGRPVVNLGFSSNGLLEKPLLDLIAGIDAAAYILDCLPNMRTLPAGTTRERILAAVPQLRASHPVAPIVLADHGDANIMLADTGLQHAFSAANRIGREAFAKLQADGVKNIHYLNADKIGLHNESTVDGQHPNDLGMLQYAEAYYQLLKGKVPPAAVSSSLRNGVITRSEWNGCLREDLTVAGRHCILVTPNVPAPGRPWIWRTEFFGAFASADSMLAAKGFHVVYMDITDMYGAPVALGHMDNCYAYMTRERNLGRKPVLEGFSRGGLSALNWAARRPEQVSCIYLDAAVCDFRSWPGGKAIEKGFGEDWKKLKKAYGFHSDADAESYGAHPLDKLAPLAAARIPILSVYGTADPLVPPSENTDLLQARYTQLGGAVETIPKPGVGHHPHSLSDPTPIVQFILKHTAAATSNGKQAKR